MTVSLLSMALLALAGPAAASLVVTTTNETGSLPFTPTWTPATTSLIAGLTPTVAYGNFAKEDTNRTVNSLTLGGSLTINTELGNADDSVNNTTTSTNYVTGGNGAGAGSTLIYTLPAAAHGYNVTNISVYGGWADNGRDAQSYTVSYATAENPATFLYLTNVEYNPTVPANTPTANLVSLIDSAGGTIASNVVAVQFDFTFPNAENGFTGYGAITVQGTPAAVVVPPAISITASNENGAATFTPDWVVETDSLIAGTLPTTQTGNFDAEPAGSVSQLTDGIIGSSGDPSGFVTAGAGAGTTLIYTLTNSVNGSDVTNIVVYSGWGNNNRDGQYYILSYSTVTAPTTFVPITTLYFNPAFTNGNASANRVAISGLNGAPLGQNVASIKFDFASPPYASAFDNAYQGYSEIIVEGKNSAPPTAPPSAYLVQDILPTHAETAVGDQVVFTASFSNLPPVTILWQQITTNATATNNLSSGVVNVTANGVVTSTLTLNNVQLTDSGSYRAAGLNATNGAAAPSYGTAAPLAVGTPTAVGSIVVDYAGQTAPVGSGFYPAWTIATNADLVFGFPTDGSGNPGTATAGAGTFSLGGSYGDPSILDDGTLGNTLTEVVSAGWVNVIAGQSITYTLPTSTFGYNITNIAVYGGWPDESRDEQTYQVLYSTVSAPTVFNSIGTFKYVPSFTSGEPTATRTILVPTKGVLAQNVAAVEINFNINFGTDWNGYSEVTVGGTPSTGLIPGLAQDITPLTAEDVVGSSVTFSASFANATGYQWQKNGTNITGATSTNLTLSNLQLSDTATNGGYSLVGHNSAGNNSTRSCALTVDPAPAAVSNVITAFAYQTSDDTAPNAFGPTWDTSQLATSLIYQQNPPGGGNGAGNFGGGNDAAGGLPVLTDGSYGLFAYDSTHPAFAAGGPNAGQYVIYTLGANVDGYNVTNIQIAGGWNDNGRNAQYYTVYYSTVANPTLFIPITAVKNAPTFPNQSVIRTTITPAAGVLASNAYAIKVDFTIPGGVPNGYSGYSEISVFGSPATVDNLPVDVTVENEDPASGTAPTWIIETNSLIEGQLPSSHGAGAFAGSFNNEAPAGGLPVLTDGTFGAADRNLSYATCGGAFGAGSSITYTAPSGSWNLTNIVVYSGWLNYNRDGQFYNISYSTLAAPTTFIPLVTVNYNPPVPDGVNGATSPSANRVDIAPANGISLATNVYAVTFDFTPQTGGLDNGYSGYAEIVLQGTNVPATVVSAPKIGSVKLTGGNLILTGTGGIQGAGYTLLTTTNLLSGWTTNVTGFFGNGGAFSNAIPVNTTNPAAFFQLRTP